MPELSVQEERAVRALVQKAELVELPRSQLARSEHRIERMTSILEEDREQTLTVKFSTRKLPKWLRTFQKATIKILQKVKIIPADSQDEWIEDKI